MQLSVVIVHYRSLRALPRCLNALASETAGLESEVVIVDNDSRDELALWLAREHPNARALVNTTNLGYARAVNQGISATSGEYVLVMNPDVYLESGCVATLLGHLLAQPRTGLVAPELRNPSRIAQVIDREYPIGLKEARIGGSVGMSFYVNAQGVVERFEMKESSGKAELDQAALRVARQVQFTPAMRGSEPVPAWVALAIPFGENAAASSTSSSTAARPTNPTGPQPVPAQFDVAPQVLNAARVRQSLEREYPIGLRSAGIGGRVEVWFYVNERGVPERFQLKAGSGNTDLDQAALRVARVFVFTPAQLNGEPIATWICTSSGCCAICCSASTVAARPRPTIDHQYAVAGPL